MMKKLGWLAVSCGAALSLAVVTGIFNPQEKVNALWLITAAACFYAVAYRFYGSFVTAKVLALDPNIKTPARRLADGMDFHPTNRWVLFGHHFAAIAGAGPLIGPMLAAQFGYLPGFLWLLIGAVFVGAVHDVVILAASVRRNGRSLAQVGEVSAIGFLLLLLAVFAGHYIPGTSLAPLFTLSKGGLVIAMAAYGLVASILPVWMLLCPRDYLSTYMKIGTIILLAVGVIFMAPTVQMPAVTRFVDGGGPIIPGKLFPFMFITIACGAVSGFHSLISSGTTPKMLTSERDLPMIGYGAMLVEGFVSVMALVAATILIPGDYFAINTHLSFDAITALGFQPERVAQLSRLVGTDVAGRPGGAVSLAVGMASILSSIPGMSGLMPYWYNFALMFEALFILTTVDTGTRVARFLLQELGSKVYPRLGQQRWIPGIVATSLTVVAAWSYLIWSGNVSTIWPMFGVSNQLLSAIALGVGTTIIIKSRKARYAWITAIPMTFMYTTTLMAAWGLIGSFFAKAATATNAVEAFTFKANAVLVIIMAILAVVSLLDMLFKWNAYLTSSRPITTSEVVEYETAPETG